MSMQDYNNPTIKLEASFAAPVESLKNIKHISGGIYDWSIAYNEELNCVSIWPIMVGLDYIHVEFHIDTNTVGKEKRNNHVFSIYHNHVFSPNLNTFHYYPDSEICSFRIYLNLFSPRHRCNIINAENSQFIKNIAKLWFEPFGKDVIIASTENPQNGLSNKIWAHRIILGARNEILKRKLSSLAPNSILYLDFSIEAITVLLKFLYTNEIPIIQVDNALEIYQIGSYFKVKPLIEAAKRNFSFI